MKIMSYARSLLQRLKTEKSAALNLIRMEDSRKIITDEELNAIGMTREQFDKNMKEEEVYIHSWSKTVDKDEL